METIKKAYPILEFDKDGEALIDPTRFVNLSGVTWDKRSWASRWSTRHPAASSGTTPPGR